MTAEDWFWTIVLLALTALISWAFNRPSHDEEHNTEYDWDDTPFIRDVRMWDGNTNEQHKEDR